MNCLMVDPWPPLPYSEPSLPWKQTRKRLMVVRSCRQDFARLHAACAGILFAGECDCYVVPGSITRNALGWVFIFLGGGKGGKRILEGALRDLLDGL